MAAFTPACRASRLLLAGGMSVGIGFSGMAARAEDPVTTGSVTKLPIPRYVSLKPSDTPMREGPSKEHRIKWVFKREGLPVEVVGEHADRLGGVTDLGKGAAAIFARRRVQEGLRALQHALDLVGRLVELVGDRGDVLDRLADIAAGAAQRRCELIDESIYI